MRRRTRNLVLGTVGVLGVLFAFVAVVGFLASGPPYYVTATPVDRGISSGGDAATIDGSALPERRFPYTTTALLAAGDGSASGDDAAGGPAGAGAIGRSEPYRTGPIGVKEFFSHSPFDELDALRQRNPEARADEDVLVRRGNATYRVGIVREGEGS